MPCLRRLPWALCALVWVGCTTEDGGEPALDMTVPECDEGARRCTDDVVEVCDDGDWSPVGLCSGGEVCRDGACVAGDCSPACAGAECGPDGCGGVCGTCDDDTRCAEGQCIPLPSACGDGTCAADEGCATCPADCGACCGDGACAEGEDCATCPADCACDDGEACDAEQRACGPGCTPDCADARCGSDGCGGTCGDCAAGEDCLSGECVEPGPTCGDAECAGGETCATCPADCGPCCGDGACTAEHLEDCATCPADCGCPDGFRCDAETRECGLVCTPNCDGRACGPDGCDGVCGVCPDDTVCAADGQCAVAPAACGDDTCDPGEDCRTCPADCGACCGDGACAPFENCANCPVDCQCADGDVCDLEARACVDAPCQPDCVGRICGPDGCGGVCGDCDPGELCDVDRGRCAIQCVPDCGDRECGSDGCDGDCGRCEGGDRCVDGACQPPCEPVCDGRTCGPDGCGGACGACEPDQACTADGQCVGGGLGCDCPASEQCVAGVCRRPTQVCSPNTADGLCPNGRVCLAGVCVDDGTTCDLGQPTGACPVGALCLAGSCRAFDAATVCADGEPCTADVYDPARDACVHVPQAVACDDGDPCTADACGAGRCVADPIAACEPAPEMDPYPTLTNQRRVVLGGPRPETAEVLFSGVPFIAAGGDRWQWEAELEPGENRFRFALRDGDVVSSEREVVIIYDADPPSTRITPGGGDFRDGVTLTLAATEPGRVYYTTDGSTPDVWSPWVDGVRTLRVFDDTVVTVRAIDRAGNWQVEPRVERYRITGSATRWRSGPALPVGRDGLAAATDGARIFAAGGADDAGESREAFVYDPEQAVWDALPRTLRARSGAALVWHDDALYLLGGRNDGAPLNLVERLDPDAGGGWVGQRSMPSTRFGLQAVSIAGEIHVFGGETNGGAVLDSHQIYTARADAWREAGAPLPRPRTAFHAIVGPAGRVYLVGGQDEAGQPVAEVDIYDPETGAWDQAAPLPTPRTSTGAVLTENRGAVGGGTVGLVVAGGRTADGRPSAVVEELVLDDGEWRARRPLRQARVAAAAVTVEGDAPAELPDARVARGWLLGGTVYEPGVPDAPAARSRTTVFHTRDQDHLRRLSELPAGRIGHAVAGLDDRLYVVGGQGLEEVPADVSYDPETGTSRPISPLPDPRIGLSLVPLAGQLWALGGEDRFGVPQPTLAAYDPADDRWTVRRPMLVARRDAAAVTLGEQIIVVGGDNNGPVQAVEIYDPIADRWTDGPLLPSPRAGAVAVAWQGRVFVAGGRGVDGEVHADVLMLDGEAWTVVRPDGFGVVDAAVAVIAGRMVVFGGRDAEGRFSNRRRIVDLTSPDFARHFRLAPETRLLPAYAAMEGVAHNGDVYLFGGAADPDRPDGLPTVMRYDGRCLDGRIGLGEGRGPYAEFPDLGAGCGEGTPTTALDPAVGYGHHGSCNGWNDCGDGETCADLACAWFGHGPAFSWRETRCLALPSGDCDLFRGLGEVLDDAFDGQNCNVSVATQVVCLAE